MTNIQTYFCVERNAVGDANWATLLGLFDAMGTTGSWFPAYNTQKRLRLDGNAAIYESLYNTEDVTIQAFKQLLADTFGVPVADIGDIQSSTSYSPGGTTMVWEFTYNVLVRFTVRRFGGGGATWEESGNETRAYLILFAAEWETIP